MHMILVTCSSSSCCVPLREQSLETCYAERDTAVQSNSFDGFHDRRRKDDKNERDRLECGALARDVRTKSKIDSIMLFDLCY